MMQIVAAVMLALLANVAVADAATLIYFSAYDGPQGAATLYVTTPSPEGIVTSGGIIGPIGFQRVGALDFSPSGTLYGVGFNGTQTVLITIDTATGAGTQVGSLGIGNAPVQDIAFRPSDGVLFGYAVGTIITIDTTTGLATIVGDTGSFPLGNALAFRGTTLFNANEAELRTIDQTTGQPTVVTNITYHPAFGQIPRPPAMKFDPTGTTLYALVNGVNRPPTLGTIDPVTGQTTAIRSIPFWADGMAITIGPLPPGVTAVPTLSEWAQIAMVAALIVGGLAALRRRRSAPS
jgi:hypothetical protein